LIQLQTKVASHNAKFKRHTISLAIDVQQLYSFEGRTTQPTKRRVSIVHSKMDFSWQIWEQKQPVFLQCTQCNDPRETAHTWWGGEGFPGVTRVLVGGAMVMINFHIELCVESYSFHPGTSLGKRHLSPNWYQDEMHRKCCRQDIFQVADVSCLEKICVCEAGCPVFEPSNMIRVLRSSKHHATFHGNGQKVEWSG
jgi:hypothetical protein